MHSTESFDQHVEARRVNVLSVLALLTMIMDRKTDQKYEIMKEEFASEIEGQFLPWFRWY